MAHGVAEGGGVGLGVDGRGAGSDVGNVDGRGESTGGARCDDDGTINQSEGARGRGRGVCQTDSAFHKQNVVTVKSTERESLLCVTLHSDDEFGDRVTTGAGVQRGAQGCRFHFHGALDDRDDGRTSGKFDADCHSAQSTVRSYGDESAQ
ncbi:Uncharacterised protein [Chlamydia trachomatis]|nr:Uncharacterised protein [Chlamydia trachomatis]